MKKQAKSFTGLLSTHLTWIIFWGCESFDPVAYVTKDFEFETIEPDKNIEVITIIYHYQTSGSGGDAYVTCHGFTRNKDDEVTVEINEVQVVSNYGHVKTTIPYPKILGPGEKGNFVVFDLNGTFPEEVSASWSVSP